MDEDEKRLESWRQVLKDCDERDAASSAGKEAPYDTSFLVHYCKDKWAGWVNTIHGTLVKFQTELEIMPYRRHLANVVKGLEILLLGIKPRYCVNNYPRNRRVLNDFSITGLEDLTIESCSLICKGKYIRKLTLSF